MQYYAAGKLTLPSQQCQEYRRTGTANFWPSKWKAVLELALEMVFSVKRSTTSKASGVGGNIFAIVVGMRCSTTFTTARICCT